MSEQNIHPISRETFTLNAANNHRVGISYTAEFLRVIETTETIEFSVNRSGQFAPLQQNGLYRMPRDSAGRPQEFNYIEFRRLAGSVVTPIEIEIIIGSGDYETGSVQLLAAVDINAGQAIRDTPAGTLNGGISDLAPVATGGANATALIAASTIAVRKGVKIKNTGAVALRIAGTDADAKSGTKGDYLSAGESCFYPVAGALYGAGVGGVGACSVAELLW